MLKNDKNIINIEFKGESGENLINIKDFIIKLINENSDIHGGQYTWLNRGLQNFLINYVVPALAKIGSDIVLTAYDIAKCLDDKKISDFLEKSGVVKSKSKTFINRIIGLILPKLVREYIIPEIKKAIWDRMEGELAHQTLKSEDYLNSLYTAFGNVDIKTIEQILNSFKYDKNKEDKIRNILLQTSKSGYNPLHMAADQGLDETVGYLLESAKNISDNYETLKSMIKMTTYDKENALHLAVKQTKIKNAVYSEETVQKLLDSFKEEKDRNILNELILARDINDRTPFHDAAKESNLNIVKKLLATFKEDKDHDTLIQLVSASDKNGKTPLHLAVESGKLDIVKFLIEKKAEVNSTDNSGRSPLFWAVEEGNLDVVTFLIKNGADPNNKDKEGKTPLTLAKQNDYQNIVSILSNQLSS